MVGWLDVVDGYRKVDTTSLMKWGKCCCMEGFFFFTAATNCVSARGYINVQAFIVGEEHTVVMYRDYEQGREEEVAGVWRVVVDLVVWDRKIFFFCLSGSCVFTKLLVIQLVMGPRLKVMIGRFIMGLIYCRFV
jgi:hypothetical protein